MNKVEKIKAEIERLKESLPWGSCASQISMECNCKNEAYNEVLSYIDSLKEPVKRTPAEIEAAMQEIEEKSKLFTEAHKDDVVSNDTIKVISNDLEEAATKYARKQLSNPDYPTYNDEYEMECAFEAGAQWQKKQIIKKSCEWLSNISIEDMTYKYNDFDTSEDWYKFIEDFKKVMEE